MEPNTYVCVRCRQLSPGSKRVDAGGRSRPQLAPTPRNLRTGHGSLPQELSLCVRLPLMASP